MRPRPHPPDRSPFIFFQQRNLQTRLGILPPAAQRIARPQKRKDPAVPLSCPSQSKGSSTTRSASTGLRRKMEADSTNFSGLSVVRKRQVPPCVHKASISA